MPYDADDYCNLTLVKDAPADAEAPAAVEAAAPPAPTPVGTFTQAEGAQLEDMLFIPVRVVKLYPGGRLNVETILGDPLGIVLSENQVARYSIG